MVDHFPNRRLRCGGTGRLLMLLLLPCLAVLSGCGKRGAEPVRPVSIDRYREVDDFSFTNQAGETAGRADLLGKVWVANFVFTSCGAECLVLSQKMAALQQRFADRDDVAFVSFSVDPGTDSPERLDGYARRWGADREKWQFFTGDPGALDAIIKESFLLPVMRSPEEQANLASSNFIHSNKLAIVDRQGVVRAYVEGLETGAVDQAFGVVQTLLAEPAPAPAPAAATTSTTTGS